MKILTVNESSAQLKCAKSNNF